jgi:hypothetical protein
VTVRRLLPLPLAALLGVLAAVLVACGSSGSGLIPSANAGPLASDFQAVERAAQAGNGDCNGTAAALSTTEHDFHLLPSSVDAGLRGRLAEGIRQLRTTALEMCAQPAAASTTSTSETSTQTKIIPPSTTTSTGTQTTSTGTSTLPESTTGAGTTPTTTPSEGGTAPEVGSGEGQTGEGGASGGQGGAGSGGSSGGGSSGAGQGPGAGAGEGAKGGGISGGTGSGEQ